MEGCFQAECENGGLAKTVFMETFSSTDGFRITRKAVEDEKFQRNFSRRSGLLETKSVELLLAFARFMSGFLELANLTTNH